MKRILSLLICITLLAGMVVLSAHAEGQQRLFKDRYMKEYIDPEFTEYFDDTMYHELYYHDSPSGEIDWALIYVAPFIEIPWSVSAECNGYILSSNNEGAPFSFGYGIYDVAADEFIDVFEAARTGRYPDLKENFHYGRPVGDADGDGMLMILDSTYIQRCLAEIDNFDGSDMIEGYPLSGKVPLYYSDADYDNERTVMDATRIQRRLANLHSEPDYISGTNYMVSPIREISGEAFEYVALEKHLNDDPSSMRNAYRNAIVKSAAEFVDFTGETSEVYDDAFFADHALYIVYANVSDIIGNFSVKAMTFDGATLYPEFSYIGYDNPRTAGYDLHEQIYEIPRSLSEQIRAIVPMEDKSACYPVYNSFIMEKGAPSDAANVGFVIADKGIYSGSQRSLPSFNTISNAFISSPAELKDFLGIEDERYNEPYFENKMLYAAIFKNTFKSAACYEYTPVLMSRSGNVLYVGCRETKLTPNDNQHRFVLCEIDKTALEEIESVHTYKI